MRRLAAVICAALLPVSPLAAEPPREVLVAAAANLKSAAEELARAFEEAHPGVRVRLTFGASGALSTQILNGAPFDLFLSADREYPAKLVAAGRAEAEDERVYAFGKLAAWRPATSRVDLEGAGLAALREPAVRRIAIANPALAPFGRAAEHALRAAGLLEAVRAKLALGSSAAQAAQFATTGAADVAFLPLSLTREPALAGGRVYLVPEHLYPRVEQSGVVLRGARAPGLARAFLALLASPRGRALLERYGYGLP